MSFLIPLAIFILVFLFSFFIVESDFAVQTLTWTFIFPFILLASNLITVETVYYSVTPEAVFHDKNNMIVIYKEKAYLTKDVDILVTDCDVKKISMEQRTTKSWANLPIEERYKIVYTDGNKKIKTKTIR
jgi:hypothetical protein